MIGQSLKDSSNHEITEFNNTTAALLHFSDSYNNHLIRPPSDKQIQEEGKKGKTESYWLPMEHSSALF